MKRTRAGLLALSDSSGNGNTLSNSQVAFTNGAALFSSARTSSLTTLSALPFNDCPDVTVAFFFSVTNGSSSYRFLLMSGETYGLQGSLSCYGEPDRSNLVTEFHDSAARPDSGNTPDNTLYDGPCRQFFFCPQAKEGGGKRTTGEEL